MQKNNFYYRGAFKDTRGRERGIERVSTLGQTTPLLGIYYS